MLVLHNLHGKTKHHLLYLQNQTYYTVFNGYQPVSLNSSNQVNVDLFASANVNDAGGYYSYKIHVSGGNFYVQNNTGGVYLGNGSTSWGAVSDERKKDIIEHISDALTKVNGLRAVIGKFKVEETYDDDVLYSETEWKPTGKNTGDVKYAKGSAKVGDDVGVRRSFLIAQDVKSVLPEAVDDSDADNLSLRYTDVIPLLVASIKELKTKVETLETKVATLEGGG